MPRSDLARDRVPTPRIQKVIDHLRAGRTPVDPVRASWDIDDAALPIFTYRNFHLGRDEWGRGKIPQDLLWQYDDPPYGAE